MPLKFRVQQIIVLLVVLLSWNNAVSQNYYFENLSIKHGLQSSKVYDVEQDRFGYIWLATPLGISRYDGENFKQYGLKEGIDESRARAMFIDDEQNVWVGFVNGKVFVKKQEEPNFQLLISDSLNPKGEISDIVQDLKGNILIATAGNGIFYISNPLESQQKIQHFSGKDGIDQQVFGITVASDGRVFFATSVDLKYMEADTTRFHYFRPDGFPSFFMSTCMIEDTEGNFWIGKYHGGLYKYIQKTGEFLFFDTRDGLANNWVSTLFEDSHGRIWVGTWGGGVSTIENSKITATYNADNGLEGQLIHKIREDIEGNIIINSSENGLFLFRGNQFLHMNKDLGLPDQQIYDICKFGDNELLLATNKGIAEMEIGKDLDFKIKSIYNTSNSSLKDNKVRKLEVDQYNNIWIGTALNGIVKYNTAKQSFEYTGLINNYLPPNAKIINDIEVLGDELFIATVDGLINHEIKTHKTFLISQSNGLSRNDIATLYAAEDGKLWLSLRNGGLNYIDQENNITRLDKTNKVQVTCMTENSKGEIFVGSTKGVFHLQKDSLIKVVDASAGLISDYVSVLHFINDNKLVIGSNKGLNIYYLEEGQLIHYNKNVGYVGIETKPNSFEEIHDGVLLFGTTGGLMIYNPESEDRGLKEPKVYFSGMSVNLEEKKMEEDYSFRYNENSFVFNYQAISLNNRDELVYKVMLEGLDETWREPTKSRSITFSQLPPGHYTLKVKAITFVENSNDEIATYSFTIRPPFYKTWWFISASLILIVATTFFGVRYRIYLLKKEKKVLEQKVADRTKEISQKNELLADKNKHITDSINYAKRIQYATMRPENLLYQLYEEAFILYIPKDIVSGDFYWYVKKGKNLIIAAADCTGHGVPGAFMSMLGIAYLNEIVGRMNKFVASDILERLRANVINALHQSDEADSAKDGMDIALIILDTETRKLQFSGAYNPLYVLRGEELIEFKGDRMPIGVHVRDSEQFTNHQTQLEEGDQLYFFTDGFADQFGGPKGKKMNYKRFKSYLQEYSSLPVNEQKEKLLDSFHGWKGDYEQLDDVLLIGIKV